MISLRYSPGKVWGNFVIALGAGFILVVILGYVWKGSALVGGIAGLAGVALMLMFGCIKRSGRKDPVLAADDRGITIGVAGLGFVPWSAIRSADVKGVAFVTGQRLVLSYAGQAPKVTFMDKLNWGVQSRQRGELAQVVVGFLDQTDRPISELRSAIGRTHSPTAA